MSTLAQLGPIEFGSSLMWLWGLAAALPLLIHLLNRRQYQEQTWAAMEYLLRAMKKNSRRIQIEQLLLLLIRAMILILAALAWMDLIWSNASIGPVAVGGGNTHTVLVLDGSYSMQTNTGERSRFARAQQLAAEVIDAAARGDAFTLVLMGEPPRKVIGEPVFDPQDAKQEIADLRPPHAGANLAASLAVVEQLLTGVGEYQRRITNQRVCIFTDLGSTTWGEAASGDSDARLRRIAQQAPLTLFDVGQDGVENVAVTSLAKQEPYVVAGRPVSLVAQVKNFGSGDRANYPVRLKVDDRPAGEKLIDIPAGGEATVVFNHEFGSPGEHHVRAELPTDALEIDNSRWLSVPVRPSMNVLVIRGKPGAGDHVAFSLGTGRPSEQIVHVDVAAENALVERDLAEYDAVFLANVARLGRDEAAVLHQYVMSGGGLIIILGDQINVESYNRQFFSGEDTPRLLPAKLVGFSASGDWRFDPRGYEHPLMDAFRGHGNTGLLTRPIWKYVKLDVPAASEAQVALWLDNGDPAIVEEQIGRGRVLVMATTASDHSKDRTVNPPMNWSSLLSWPGLPPLMQEMFALAASGKYDQSKRTRRSADYLQRQQHGGRHSAGRQAAAIAAGARPARTGRRPQRMELHGDRT